MTNPSIPSRRCSRCKCDFPPTVEFFYRATGKKDGLTPYCKTCSKQASNAWKRRNPAENAAHSRKSRNNYLEKAREVSRKYHREHCADLRESKRQWKRQHPQQVKESNRKSNLRHPDTKRVNTLSRRARQANAPGSHTVADIERIYAEQNGLCAYCDKPLESDYHVDHKIPLVRGGSNSPDNLAIACPSCNTSKGDKLLSEWEPPLPDYSDFDLLLLI